MFSNDTFGKCNFGSIFIQTTRFVLRNQLGCRRMEIEIQNEKIHRLGIDTEEPDNEKLNRSWRNYKNNELIFK